MWFLFMNDDGTILIVKPYRRLVIHMACIGRCSALDKTVGQHNIVKSFYAKAAEVDAMKSQILLTALLLVPLLISCYPESEQPPPQAAEVLNPGFALSEAERRFVRDELGGLLRITTRVRESVFEPDKYGIGQHGGLEFEMAMLFAETLGVELEYEIVDNFSRYFALNGEVPDPDRLDSIAGGELPPYTPDSLQRTRILVDGFGYRPWREKLAILIPTIPDRFVVISRNESKIDSIDDLEGLRLASFPTAAHYQVLNAELERNAVTTIRIRATDTEELARMVSSGEADVTSSGGISALFELTNYPNLNIAFAIGSDIDFAHWLIRADDAVLAGILERFFEWALLSGEYSRIWEHQFGFPLENYLEIIGTFPQ